MRNLIRSLNDLRNKPGLLIHYAILHLFLLTAGIAIVVYCKKESVINYQQEQTQYIYEATQRLATLNLDTEERVEVVTIKLAAERVLISSKDPVQFPSR